MAILCPHITRNQIWLMDKKEYDYMFDYDIICEFIETENKRFRLRYKEYVVRDMPGVVIKYKGEPIYRAPEMTNRSARFSVRGLKEEDSNQLILRYIENRSHVQIGLIYSITSVVSSAPKKMRIPTMRVLPKRP